MKLNLFVGFLLAVTLPSSIQAQERSGRFEFSLKTAHPKAQLLMKDDFYWSPIEESGPFGSDAGSDAAYGFYKWRKGHPSGASVFYLKELIARWHFPEIGWEEMDTAKIKKYMGIPSRMDAAEIERPPNLV